MSRSSLHLPVEARQRRSIGNRDRDRRAAAVAGARIDRAAVANRDRPAHGEAEAAALARLERLAQRACSAEYQARTAIGDLDRRRTAIAASEEIRGSCCVARDVLEHRYQQELTQD